MDNINGVQGDGKLDVTGCTIFEILNARGSALEGHELLKNFIMRGIKPDGNIDSAKVTWEEIERLLGNNIERFVKHYATHKYRTSTQNSINDYKIIRNANKGIPTVPLLEDLYQKAIYYSRLINPIMQGEHTLIQNARKSKSENSEPDFQQLSLF